MPRSRDIARKIVFNKTKKEIHARVGFLAECCVGYRGHDGDQESQS